MPQRRDGSDYGSTMGNNQRELFDEQQPIELARVTGRIGEHVLAFVESRLASGNHTFFIRDLHDWIVAATQTAPASPDRILRQLRMQGLCNYRVLDRRKSFYELIP